jgi:hypothetical protein
MYVVLDAWKGRFWVSGEVIVEAILVESIGRTVQLGIIGRIFDMQFIGTNANDGT